MGVKDARRRILLAQPHVVNKASAAISSFSTDLAVPLKRCVAQIEPVQDLHGYDSPWPAGDGKNKIPLFVDGFKTINTTGSWNGNSYTENGITYTVQLDNGGNVTGVNVNGTASSNSFFRYVKGLAVSAGAYVLNGAPSDASTETFVQYAYTSAAYYDTGSGVNVTIDSTMPNINIRVMSGVSVSNKLFKPMFRLASETDSAFAPYSNICPISGWEGATIRHSGADTSAPTIYSITFPSEAGTVYGGTLDVVNGVLTVDRKLITLTGSEAWSAVGSKFYLPITDPQYANRPEQQQVSNLYTFDKQSNAGSTGVTVDKSFYLQYVRGYNRIWAYDTSYTLETFKAMLDQTPLQFTIPITVQTIQLTRQRIAALVGANNVWADTGNTELSYWTH